MHDEIQDLHPSLPRPSGLSRRNFMESVTGGFYAAALGSILRQEVSAGEVLESSTESEHSLDLNQRPTHIRPSAKSVIHLFMHGGPSQMDLFDPKSALDRLHGKSYFDKIAGEVENVDAAGAILRSPFKFARHGRCGAWVSEVMPHLAGCVDDIAFIRSMYTTNLTHEPALRIIHSGRMLPGLPTIGSWVSYGLGTVNQNLPGYVVLDDPLGLPINKHQNWQCGFLPPVYQGTRFRATGSPVLNLERQFVEPDEITQLERDLIGRVDRRHLLARPGQTRLDARISSYELAARMQLEASDALDLRQESPQTLEAYGVGKGSTDSYGRRCLIARRLVERGVRFVQLFINSQIWDTHYSHDPKIRKASERTDQPVAALLKDLKQRGLLDETLVVWGGEFGRLPIAQVQNEDLSRAGRDHNKNAMCSWMAGGGVRGGVTHGSTDELGLKAAENPVSVPDFHATILHLLGLDHERVTFHRHGFPERLTGTNEVRIIEDILA